MASSQQSPSDAAEDDQMSGPEASSAAHPHSNLNSNFVSRSPATDGTPATSTGKQPTDVQNEGEAGPSAVGPSRNLAASPPRRPLDVLHERSAVLDSHDLPTTKEARLLLYSDRARKPPSRHGVNSGSAGVRRTHAVYQTDEPAETKTGTPPKRLKLTLPSSAPPSLSKTDASAYVHLAQDPPSGRSATDNQGPQIGRPETFAMSTAFRAPRTGPATSRPTSQAWSLDRSALDEPGSRAASPSESSVFRLQPPIIAYRPRGLSKLSNLRSTLQLPQPTLDLSRNRASGASQQDQADPSVDPCEGLGLIGGQPIPAHSDDEDDDVIPSDVTSLNVDEQTNLPSPRLSPVSGPSADAGSPSGPGDGLDSDSGCAGQGPRWFHPDIDWSEWNIGHLSPHAVYRSKSRLESSATYLWMMGWFNQLSPECQAYVFSEMFHSTSMNVLRYAANTAAIALKIDIFAALPVELSRLVVSHLDAKSLCQAAQVSKTWRSIVDTDENAWHQAVVADGLEPPDDEIERAVRQGWGWQDPNGPDAHESNLGKMLLPGHLPALAAARENNSSSGSAELAERIRRRKSDSSDCCNSVLLPAEYSQDSRRLAALYKRFGKKCPPYTYAQAAKLQIPNPSIGLPSILQVHFFKSLYRRHHLIRRSWMDPTSKPYHIAFQVQQRHVITCLQFDSEKILTGSDNTNIHVYETSTGRRLANLPGHSGGVWALQYVGNTLVSGSTDRSVRVWDIEKGACLHTFQGHTSTVRCLLILQPVQVSVREDGSAVMIPPQPLIITGSRDSTIRMWRLPDTDEKSVFQSGPSANESDNPYFVRVLSGHEHSVRAIAAHGDLLVSGSYDWTVRVWEISTGKCKHRLTGHGNKVYSVVLDYGRGRCMSGSMDNTVKVWNFESGDCLFTLKGHTNLVGLLDLSHDLLISAAADCTLRVWDPNSGKCLHTLSSHTGTITCFQHDGLKAISGGDRTLKLWNLKDGSFVRDLLTDLTAMWQVKFDQRRCVAAVQRHTNTFIEVLDFGAARDGVPAERRGIRFLVDKDGIPLPQENQASDDALATPAA